MPAVVLCSVADVKRYAVTAQSNNLDDLISELITTETTYIEQYLNRRITDAGVDLVEYHDGEGGRLIPLSVLPVTAVSSVIVNDLPWAAASKVTDVGFQFNSRFLIAKNTRFPEGLRNVKVTYRGGYTQATLPPDFSQAVAELVALRLEERKHQGMRSKTLNGETITYDTDHDIPKSIADRLDNYKTYIGSTPQ